jgi:hypothetical protein
MTYLYVPFELFGIEITELISIIEFSIFPGIWSGVFPEIIGSDKSTKEGSVLREYDGDIAV